jgi:hypothetical protein
MDNRNGSSRIPLDPVCWDWPSGGTPQTVTSGHRLWAPEQVGFAISNL